jgi:hypothetical protein
MDSTQEQHERRIGEQLIEWYNQRRGTLFQFVGRPGDAPDLIYEQNHRKLGVEVVSAFYDDREDAKFQWLNARLSRPSKDNNKPNFGQ